MPARNKLREERFDLAYRSELERWDGVLGWRAGTACWNGVLGWRAGMACWDSVLGQLSPWQCECVVKAVCILVGQEAPRTMLETSEWTITFQGLGS